MYLLSSEGDTVDPIALPVNDKSVVSVDTRFYTYEQSMTDYKLSRTMLWDRVTVPVAHGVIGGTRIALPYTYYVFITCIDVEICDWSLVEEMIGRPIPILTITSDMKRFATQEFIIENIEHTDIYLPKVKQPLLVSTQCASRFVLLSPTDLIKTHKLQISDLII